jgi:LysR family hydrogen peroxide-inducible transcriptional activator
MTPEVAVISPRDLEYVVSIAENLNFRLASEECAVSQPALSAQIKKVEDSLDVQIFERTNRRVMLTPVGEKIVAQARVVLDELEFLGSIARGADRPLEGTFNLGLPPTLLAYLVPRLIAPLSKHFPKLELSLREAPERELLEELKTGKLDAIIAPSFEPTATKGLQTFSLFREPILLALSTKSPLANKEYISVKTLTLENMVLLDSQDSLTEMAYQLVTTEGTQRPMHTSSIESLCCMVANTNKYSLIPLLASYRKRELRSLTYLKLRGSSVSRRIDFCWRSRFRGSQSLKNFAPIVKNLILSQYPGLLK